MNAFWAVLSAPLVFALGVLVLGGRRPVAHLLAFTGSLVFLVCAAVLVALQPVRLRVAGSVFFECDVLSSLVLLAASGFAVLISLYSVGYFEPGKPVRLYYAGLLATAACAAGAVLAAHWIVFLIAWGMLGLLLYLMILLGGDNATSTAKKAFLIVGASDSLLLLGVAILYRLTGSLLLDAPQVPTNALLPWVAYLCLLSAALAKAGAMPFHTWVPDMASVAPAPVTAYLPASLDKLLGIYLLARICGGVFDLTGGAQAVLLVIGAVTVVAAVMMALVQHDYRRLLGYHAVSQVGYMVLGFGAGTAIGMAGGLFHMLNNAIYKSCLFLAGGAVERETGEADLDRLGGLAKAMPWTFGAALVCSLAISGVPPLNGFVSKWLVYQGLVQRSAGGNWLPALCLAAAMFGSALTMASFVKLLHAMFLGPRSEAVARRTQPVKEAPAPCRAAMTILAAACVLLGLLGTAVVLPRWLAPALGLDEIVPLGVWQGILAGALLILGVAIGWGVAANRTTVREDDNFVGGESTIGGTASSGVDFYETVREMAPFGAAYRLAERKTLDIYEVGKNCVGYCTGLLRAAHTGSLETYVTWAVVGLVLMLWLFARAEGISW